MWPLHKPFSEMTNDDMVVCVVISLCLPLLISISEGRGFGLWKSNHKNNIDESYLGRLSETFEYLSLKVIMHVTFLDMSMSCQFDSSPTQVQRKTMLELTNHILNFSVSIVMLKVSLINQDKWYADLRRYVEIMMQTDIIH